MIEITEEIIQTIYDRAIQFSIAKYGRHPIYIRLCSTDLVAMYERYGIDNNSYDIKVEDLSADLDIIIKERKEKEEKERRNQEIYEKERKKQREEEDKKLRKKLYESLKGEFGNED